MKAAAMKHSPARQRYESTASFSMDPCRKASETRPLAEPPDWPCFCSRQVARQEMLGGSKKVERPARVASCKTSVSYWRSTAEYGVRSEEHKKKKKIPDQRDHEGAVNSRHRRGVSGDSALPPTPTNTYPPGLYREVPRVTPLERGAGRGGGE